MLASAHDMVKLAGSALYGRSHLGGVEHDKKSDDPP
jgi:hypothetical protein